MKKLSKSLVASVVLSASLAPAAVFAANFPDLDAASFWAKDEIVKAQQMGLVQGDDKGFFRPLDNITRQEVAAIVSRILQLDTSEFTSTSFTDTAGQWGANYIEAVHKAGLMNGDGNGLFRPNDKITREELSVLLVRSSNVDTAGKAANLTVADKNQISDWAKDAVQTGIELGLMKGDGVNFFPKANAHREEIAVTAVRLVGYLGLHTVSDISATTAVINGVPYQLADNVKGILNPENLGALRNAKISFETGPNNTITKITRLELMNDGTLAVEGTAKYSGNLVLDGNNATLDGNLKVSGDYVTIKNLNLKGNLELGSKVANDFYSKNVKVDGTTLVNGGGADTVTFENSTLPTVGVNKAQVKVEATGTTVITQMSVKANSTVSVGADSSIKELSLLGSSALVVQGTADKVEVLDATATVELAEGARIKELVLHEPVDISQIVKDYDTVKDQIDKITSIPVAPLLNNVSAVDEVGAADTITVKALSVGDTIKLYLDNTAVPAVQSVQATGDTVILPVDLQTLGDKVFLSLVRNDVESARMEVNITGVTLDSDTYQVDDVAGTISGVGADTTVADFLSKLEAATGATVKVYQDNTLETELTTGNVAAGNVVVVTKGQVKKKYEVK